MKKFLLILVAMAALMLVFTACSRDENGDDPVATLAPPNGGAEAPTLPPADLGRLGPHNPQHWTMMVVTDSMPPADDNWLVARIRDELGVTLTFDIVSSDLQDQRVATMLVADELPDIIMATQLEAHLATGGALMRLDDLLFSGKFPRLAYHHAPYRGRFTLRVEGTPEGIYQLGTWNRFYTDDQGGGPIMSPGPHGGTGMWIQKAVLEYHGFPDLSNMTLERYFDMIEAYMQSHPTIDGMPTIGFTSLMLGRVWAITNPPVFLAGHPNNGEVMVENGIGRVFHTNEYAEYYWRALNDAFHRGLVDPETWTRTSDEYQAVLSQGRVLGFSDQGWAINYTARAALIERGAYNRTWIPLMPLKNPATTTPWYADRPVLNVNQGIGIPVTASQEEAELILLFLETLMQPEWQKLFTWGREGIDYFVDENGMFYRNQEQRDNANIAAWRASNRFEVLWDAIPKIQGSLPCGNAYTPGNQAREFYEGLSGYFRDFLTAYGKGTWAEFVNDPPSNPPYYPAWQAPIPGGTPAAEAAAQIEEIRMRLVPGLISAPPGEFDARWAEYLAEFAMVNVAALEAQIQEFLDMRIRYAQ